MIFLKPRKSTVPEDLPRTTFNQYGSFGTRPKQTQSVLNQFRQTLSTEKICTSFDKERLTDPRLSVLK